MNSFENFLSSLDSSKVIAPSISYDTYAAIDLSPNNPKLTEELLADAANFEAYIEEYLNENNALVAYGGYTELRNLYKRSTIFNDTASEERDIHIGLDLWIKAGTSVTAPLDGKVHSFNFNKGIGDYGPTIILEHHLENDTFYTLYGHLSEESIKNIKIEDEFRQGETIGTLGDASVNGGYAPHLHFQIIKDIKDYAGDYPGVCSKSDLDYYLENCPDPNLLLKIK